MPVASSPQPSPLKEEREKSLQLGQSMLLGAKFANPIARGLAHFPLLLGRRELGRDFPEHPSRFAPQNPSGRAVLSLSSSGGEGWGEEASSFQTNRGSWGGACLQDFYVAAFAALTLLYVFTASAQTNSSGTNLPASVRSPEASLEAEFQELLGRDDDAKAESEKWIQDNDAFAASGGGVPSAELNRRILARFEPVRKAYDTFLERHPDHARARTAYGSLLRDLHDEEGAQKQWERALTIQTNDPAIYDNLATVYAEYGPREKAFDYLERALSLNPREPLYHHNLGDVLYLFRKEAAEHYHIDENAVFAKVLQCYTNALRLDPGNFVYATDIATTYYAIRPLQLQPALQSWTNALRLAKDDVERQGVFLHMARINLAAGRLEEARRHLDAVTDEHYADLKARLARNLASQQTPATNAPATLNPTNSAPKATAGQKPSELPPKE
jgi:tetratricopeptide (TPR) repeat protein